MKVKIIGYSVEAMITGLGIMIAKYGDALAWIGFILIGGGIVSIIITALWNKITDWMPITVIRKKTIKEAEPSEEGNLCKSQEGHEEQWLRPVIEWIDLNRQRLPPKKIILKYQIDSGLVYPFKPYRMWLKLRIGQYEPKDGWEVVPTPNLLKCSRTQFASEEFTVHDDDLLKIIEGCRQGLQVAQTLKIIVQLREGESLKVLEGSYSVNPYSEFSQETRE